MEAQSAHQEQRGERTPVVLVVDDDPSLRMLFTLALETAGFHVLVASDGNGALEVLERSTVDLVLLDSRMPGKDGHATLAAIRGNPRTADLSVIFLTGSVDVADRVRGLDAGANDYLQKPLAMEELVARVRAHLRGRDVWRRRLEESLRGRARISAALGQLRVGSSAEETAGSVCASLAGLEEGTGTVIVGFAADGDCLALGAAGDGLLELDAGDRLPRSLATYLRDRATSGAWVERRAAQPAGAVGVPLAGPAVTAAAYVPLPAAEGPIGVLVMSATQTADGAGDPAQPMLSAAIDFAPVVSALLAPRLRDEDESEGRRHRMRAVIAQGAFHPVFQPIIDLERREVVGYEALTRFDDGRPPERVFAEASGLGMGLDLELATARAAIAASEDLPGDTWLSLNVSPGLLLEVDRVRAVLAATDRPMVLELTEHDPIADYADVLGAVGALQDGLRLSVDDAGAGYSCLHHILALRPAFVKLDRGWVSGIETDPARQALVAGLGAFAERTDGYLIAEGIEEPGELETLSELAVTLGQGYLLGRPEEAAAHAGARVAHHGGE